MSQQMQRPHDQFLVQLMNTSFMQHSKSCSQTDLIFNLFRDDATQISVLPSHQRMPMSLATNLLAEWEGLWAECSISKQKCKRYYMYAVQE